VGERPGDDHPAVGEPEQDDVIEILVQHVVDDVFDVGRQPDLWTGEVNPLAETGERWRGDVVPGVAQHWPHLAEAVRARPGAVNENVRRHAPDPTHEARIGVRGAGAPASVHGYLGRAGVVA
jgi:hypothetical protein